MYQHFIAIGTFIVLVVWAFHDHRSLISHKSQYVILNRALKGLKRLSLLRLNLQVHLSYSIAWYVIPYKYKNSLAVITFMRNLMFYISEIFLQDYKRALRIADQNHNGEETPQVTSETFRECRREDAYTLALTVSL